MPGSLEKCSRKDFYKLDGVASRAILGRHGLASPVSRAFSAERKRRVLGLKSAVRDRKSEVGIRTLGMTSSMRNFVHEHWRQDRVVAARRVSQIVYFAATRRGLRHEVETCHRLAPVDSIPFIADHLLPSFETLDCEAMAADWSYCFLAHGFHRYLLKKI